MHAAITVEWKFFAFVSFFTWNYASDCIQVHVSVTIIKYDTLLRDLVDYQVELWNDFASAKMASRWLGNWAKILQNMLISYFQMNLQSLFTRGQFWPSGIVVACVCSCGRQSRACPRDNLWLVPARITKFEPDMKNILVIIPIVLRFDWSWSSRSKLTWKSKFTLFGACPHDHSPPVEVRISKVWPKMHLSSVKIPVNFGIDWSWSPN